MRLERLGKMEIYGCGSSGTESGDQTTREHPASGAQGQCWPGCRTTAQSSNEVNHSSSYHGNSTTDRNILLVVGGGGVANDDDDHNSGGGLYDDGSSRSPLVTEAAGSSCLQPSSDATTSQCTIITANSRSRSSGSRKIGSHLRMLTFIALVLLTQLSVNISIGK